MNLYQVTFVKNGDYTKEVIPADSDEQAIEKILENGVEVIVDVEVYAKLGNDE